MTMSVSVFWRFVGASLQTIEYASVRLPKLGVNRSVSRPVAIVSWMVAFFCVGVSHIFPEADSGVFRDSKALRFLISL